MIRVLSHTSRGRTQCEERYSGAHGDEEYRAFIMFPGEQKVIIQTM